MVSKVDGIHPLPTQVATQVKSSASIPNLDAVIIGLLKNALDAGASKISVHVDYPRGSCTVEDDGIGIEPFEFSMDGGLGKPYGNSHVLGHVECY